MTTTEQVLGSLRTAMRSCSDSLIGTPSGEEADLLAHALLQLAGTYQILSDPPSRKNA